MATSRRQFCAKSCLLLHSNAVNAAQYFRSAALVAHVSHGQADHVAAIMPPKACRRRLQAAPAHRG
jgi:hypothetical protein